MSKLNQPQTSTQALMHQDTGLSDNIEGMPDFVDPDFVDDGSHLDEFLASDADGSGVIEHGVIGVDDVQEEADAQSQQIDKESFWIVFQTGFQAPSFVMPMFAPLAIQEAEMPAGRAASDAVYRLLEIYYPRALSPNSETLAHLMVAAPFIIGKVMIVRAIMQEVRRPAPPPQQPKTANENQRPSEAKTRTAVKDTLSWMDAEDAA